MVLQNKLQEVMTKVTFTGRTDIANKKIIKETYIYQKVNHRVHFFLTKEENMSLNLIKRKIKSGVFKTVGIIIQLALTKLAIYA